MSQQRSKGSPPPPRRLIIEITIVYLVSVLATIGLFELTLVHPFFRQYLHTLVGAMFVALPMIALLPRRESFDSYGLPPQPIWREVLFALVVALILFPPFVLTFLLWWGWDRPFALVFPEGFLNAALTNLVVVALPEELFYRGYLMGRLDHLLKGRLTIFRTKIGLSLLLASALFALGHFVVTWDPQRLAVFFPALIFGWMRITRRSITAAVVFHALCNIYMDMLLLSFGIMPAHGYYS